MQRCRVLSSCLSAEADGLATQAALTWSPQAAECHMGVEGTRADLDWKGSNSNQVLETGLALRWAGHNGHQVQTRAADPSPSCWLRSALCPLPWPPASLTVTSPQRWERGQWAEKPMFERRPC